jgi:hypothetical protein
MDTVEVGELGFRYLQIELGTGLLFARRALATDLSAAAFVYHQRVAQRTYDTVLMFLRVTPLTTDEQDTIRDDLLQLETAIDVIAERTSDRLGTRARIVD